MDESSSIAHPFVDEYECLYSQLNPDSSPTVSFSEMTTFLKRSEINSNAIEKIWAIVDPQMTLAVDKRGAIAAMKLVAALQQSLPIHESSVLAVLEEPPKIGGAPSTTKNDAKTEKHEAKKGSALVDDRTSSVPVATRRMSDGSSTSTVSRAGTVNGVYVNTGAVANDRIQEHLQRIKSDVASGSRAQPENGYYPDMEEYYAKFYVRNGPALAANEVTGEERYFFEYIRSGKAPKHNQLTQANVATAQPAPALSSLQNSAAQKALTPKVNPALQQEDDLPGPSASISAASTELHTRSLKRGPTQGSSPDDPKRKRRRSADETRDED